MAPKSASDDRSAKTSEPATATAGVAEAFEALARDYAAGACIMRPAQLVGRDRRLHVRSTIIEDHASRIDEKVRGVEEKFDKLAGSPFAFFRGTSLLFYRDMAGEDARMPTVMLLGDVHPENFGVMPNADNVPIFGVNDFDDAYYGPFTWDLKRGVTGFMLAVEDRSGLGAKHQRRIARAFLDGYISGIEYFARHRTESNEQLRPDNSPKLIRQLFKDAMKSRTKWLHKRYLDETGRGFRANEEFTPISNRIAEFQKQIDKLAKRNKLKPGKRLGTLKIKDVAIRHGQGTASLGLPRYYILLEGAAQDATDDLIVEFKQARRSALEGLVPNGAFDAGTRGERIAHGQSVHLANGDVFYGAVEIDGMSFMSRERAPFRDDMDIDDLSKDTWKDYAAICGHALALAHARSDDAGELDYDVEPSILDAMHPVELFVEDIMEFADEAIARLRQDHTFFKQDRQNGAFNDMMKSYR